MIASEIWLFVLAAIALLGSPGPAVAALVAIGRRRGFQGSLRFYCGLQVGLALGAAMTAAGFLSLLEIFPLVRSVMTAAAAVYLAWLAYKIATGPLRGAETYDADSTATTGRAGFLLGITNPKAYLAFFSLMASYVILPEYRSGDVGLKWSLVVSVLIIVDLVWLWLGVFIGKLHMTPRVEKTMNILMGGTILLTALRIVI